MMANNGHNGNGLLRGFLIGSAVGALAAILLAPKSGRDLRWDIKERGYDTLDGAKRLYTDAQIKAKALVEGAKSGVEDLRKNLSL